MEISKKYEYTPMTPQEFARCLDDTAHMMHNKMSLGQVSRLTGIAYTDLKEMSNGKREIPHLLRLFMVSLSSLQGYGNFCRNVTDIVIVKGDRFNAEAKRSLGSGSAARDAMLRLQIEEDATYRAVGDY